jgi:hypothetical protein
MKQQKRRRMSLDVDGEHVQITAGRYAGCVGYVDDYEMGFPLVIVLFLPNGEESSGGLIVRVRESSCRVLTPRELAALNLGPTAVTEAMLSQEVKDIGAAKRGGAGPQ